MVVGVVNNSNTIHWSGLFFFLDWLPVRIPHRDPEWLWVVQLTISVSQTITADFLLSADETVHSSDFHEVTTLLPPLSLLMWHVKVEPHRITVSGGALLFVNVVE